VSANVVTLLAAIVAVVGTLTSPVLTQHYATRARQQELEAGKEQRLEERVEALQRTSLLDRRQNYTALHTAAWEFRRALKNRLFEDSDPDELESARQVFLASYRNSQMICTDPVLEAAVPAYDELTDAYGKVKRLALVASKGDARPDERQDIQRVLNTGVEHAIREMRRAMRVDLGVSAASVSASDQ